MNSARFSSLCAALLFAAVVPVTPSASAADGPAAGKGRMLVYIGSYSPAEQEGIHCLELNMTTGKLTKLSGTRGVKNPSFLAIHPNKRYLYAVSEVDDTGGKPTGAVSAFAIDAKSGALKPLNWQSSGGGGPCHLTVDRRGRAVLVANYGGGSVESIPIGKGGRLNKPASFIQHKGSSVNPARQKGPHAHSINLDPSNRFAVAADLGLDKVLVYRFDSSTGKLKPNDPPFVKVNPGGGPRHFSFHPSGRFAYACNEIASTVTAFRFDAKAGRLTPLQTTSSLPEPHKGNSTAEVQVHPSGKFLYCSNRGHDSIAMFRIDQKTGRLTAIGHESTRGKTPRNFGIDPTGNFLLAANQSTNNVVVFRIDGRSGKLKATGISVKVPRPVCVKFLAQ
jgi:6-phosphogluconolactonase